MTVSTRPGMGALLFAGGASFRVWAPFATNVCVAGSFNGWSMTANPLTPEENGYWSTDVSGAKLDDQYKFVLTSPFSNKPIWKNDPYARAMTNSVGNSIIAETDYAWTTAGFSARPGTSSSSTNCMSRHSASIPATVTDGEPSTRSPETSITSSSLGSMRSSCFRPTNSRPIFRGATTLPPSSPSRKATAVPTDCGGLSTPRKRVASQ